MSAGARRARQRLGKVRVGSPVQPEGTCPTGKVRWSSEETACVALARAAFSPAERRQEIRAYQCETCGGWHLTSRLRNGAL